MSETSQHLVRPEDERRHPSDAEPLWGESYYLDFATDDGARGGYVRLGWYPNLGVVWWTAAIVEPGGPSHLWVCYDAPATSTTSATGPNFTADLDVATPLEEMRVRARGVGDSYADAVDVYRGTNSEPIGMELDLSWRTDGQPFHYGSVTRYEIPCLVSGSLQLGDRTVTVEGQGQRDHSWGVRDWWAFGWCWMAARLTDGARLHAVDVRIPGMDVAFGYVQDPPGSLVAVDRATVSEDLGPEGLPTRGRANFNDGLLALEIEPLGFAPLVLTSGDGRIARFPRAMARFTESGGRSGLGWIEWNQPQGD